MNNEEKVMSKINTNISIDSDLKKLDCYFKGIKWSELKHNEIINKVVIIISKLWRVHCFREGNTRSTTVFLYLLMDRS